MPARRMSMPFATVRAVPAVVCAAALATACSAPPPMTDTAASADGVMREVLAALAREDRARLDALAITEGEFKDHVWEHLPAARPERNLPMSYVWGDLHQKSGGGLTRALALVDGRTLDLVRVRFTEEPRDYGPFVVHGGTVVEVRRADGTTEELRVCGSLIESGGRWKVFSYVVDE